MLYFDYNATTPCLPDLQKLASRFLKKDGNPSSHYQPGRDAKEVVASAREQVSSFLGGDGGQILFTGSGTEANNQVLKSVLWRFLQTNEPTHVITSSIEHPSVLETLYWMERLGVELTVLPVDHKGCVSRETLIDSLRQETRLISIMMVNNETGGYLGIEPLIEIARERGILFHSDCVQVAGKAPISVDSLGLDFATISGHKFHGVKGVGALYVRDDSSLESLLHGGGQEFGFRAGTEPVFNIAMMGAAAQWMMDSGLEKMSEVRVLRDYLWAKLSSVCPNVVLNTPLDSAVSNTLNVSFPGHSSEGLIMRLDLEGICVSSGSACSTGTLSVSHVLTAMGCEHRESAVRFSLGVLNTQLDVDRLLESLVQLLV